MLRAAGLRADKRLLSRGSGGRASTFALTVPRSDETRALAVLGENGLPRPAEPSATASNKLLFLPSSSRAETTATLAASLSETLERMAEVGEARVHLALPEPEPLSPIGSLRPTAAVYLKLRAPLAAPVADIAALVAHAVPGLDAQDVSVLATPSAVKLPSSDVKLSHIGPFHIATDSRPALIFVLAALGLLGATSLFLGYLAWPRRRTRQPGRASEASPPPASTD